MLLPLVVLCCSLVLYLIQLKLFEQVNSFHWLSTSVYVALAWWFGKEYDKLKINAEQDHLTKVYNRKKGQAVFQQLSKVADMRSEKLLTLFLDLDNFKLINDLNDHQTGDLVLQKVAKELCQIFGGEDEYVFRWGGDEFLVLLPINHEFDLEMLHEYLYQRLNQYHHELPVRIAFSVGHAIYPDEGVHLQELLSVADRRMYQQKSH